MLQQVYYGSELRHLLCHWHADQYVLKVVVMGLFMDAMISDTFSPGGHNQNTIIKSVFDPPGCLLKDIRGVCLLVAQY